MRLCTNPGGSWSRERSRHIPRNCRCRGRTSANALLGKECFPVTIAGRLDLFRARTPEVLGRLVNELLEVGGDLLEQEAGIEQDRAPVAELGAQAARAERPVVVVAPV